MSINLSNIDFQILIEEISNQIDYDVSLALLEEGLKEDDYIEIYKRLDRAPNRTELGMFGVMWSAHCC